MSLQGTEIKPDLRTAYNNLKSRINTKTLTDDDLEALMTFLEEQNLPYRPYQDKFYNYIFHLPSLFVYCHFLLELGYRDEVIDIAQKIGLADFENKPTDLKRLERILKFHRMPDFCTFYPQNDHFENDYAMKVLVWYYYDKSSEDYLEDFLESIEIDIGLIKNYDDLPLSACGDGNTLQKLKAYHEHKHEYLEKLQELFKNGNDILGTYVLKYIVSIMINEINLLSKNPPVHWPS